MSKAPGKAHRQGLTILEPFNMFPDEEAATEWFESIYWLDERTCRKCGSTETSAVKSKKPMPYWCKSCRSYSVFGRIQQLHDHRFRCEYGRSLFIFA